ncbi:MAG: ATP-binding cassette domain-containing protein [Bacillota bacterium]
MRIIVDSICKSYKNIKILEVDRWTCSSPAIVGIIGPNGAGKSTLVRMVAGLEVPDSGRVLYEDVESEKDISKSVTMVFQNPYMIRTSVYNNILYPLKLRKIEKNKAAAMVEDMIEQFELGAVKNNKAWTLSGGEAQKVALARALVIKPKLLVLDEPTANIDPSSMAIMENMIKKARQEYDALILLVSHNLQQARRLCDTLVFMDKGRIIEYGSSEQLIYDPQSKLTRDFINGELPLDISR